MTEVGRRPLDGVVHDPEPGRHVRVHQPHRPNPPLQTHETPTTQPGRLTRFRLSTGPPAKSKRAISPRNELADTKGCLHREREQLAARPEIVLGNATHVRPGPPPSPLAQLEPRMATHAKSNKIPNT